MSRRTVGIAQKPSVAEWLEYIKVGLAIWDNAGVGKTREDLRKALEKSYGPLSEASFRKYLYVRLPPDHARFLNAFFEVLHAIDRSLSEQFSKRIGRESLSRNEPMSHATSAGFAGREVFEFKRKKRDVLAAAALHYHAALIGEPGLPLIAKSAWLPNKLVPLRSIDQALGWIERPDDKSPVALDAFGGRTCAEWSKKLDPKTVLRNYSGYRLRDIQVQNGSLRLVCQSSDYFAFYNTCEAIAFELAQWCLHHPGRLPNPDRRELGVHRTPESIFDLSNRNAVPGLNALFLLFGGPGKDLFFLHDRSEAKRGLAEAQNMHHVVPSGTFGPDSYKDSYHERDFSLHRTVFRELAEELLGKKEVADYQIYGEDFMKDEKVALFVEGERKGHLKIFFLGLGLDPVNTKPDILLCIAADARRLGIKSYKSVFRKNWEGAHFAQPWSKERLLDWAEKPTVYPAGAACLKLAATRHFPALDSLFR